MLRKLSYGKQLFRFLNLNAEISTMSVHIGVVRHVVADRLELDTVDLVGFALWGLEKPRPYQQNMPDFWCAS